MKILLGIIISLLLIAISAIHFYWAAGGKWGAAAAVPQMKGKLAFQPGRGITAFVALIFLAFAAAIFSRTTFSLPFLPEKWAQAGVWVIAVLFILRAIGDFRFVGFTKKVKGSVFARLDSRFYSPLSFFIGLVALLICLLKN